MMTLVKRALGHRVTVATALEMLLYLAVPYILAGAVVTFFRMPYVDMLAAQWDAWMPAGADVAAFVQILVMWPGLLLTPHLCMV
jgi:hypothetical protein